MGGWVQSIQQCSPHKDLSNPEPDPRATACDKSNFVPAEKKQTPLGAPNPRSHSPGASSPPPCCPGSLESTVPLPRQLPTPPSPEQVGAKEVVVLRETVVLYNIGWRLGHGARCGAGAAWTERTSAEPDHQPPPPEWHSGNRQHSRDVTSKHPPRPGIQRPRPSLPPRPQRP